MNILMSAALVAANAMGGLLLQRNAGKPQAPVAERRDAVRALEKSSRTSFDVQIVSAVADALQDTDEIVRQFAAITLNHLLWAVTMC